MEGLPKRFDPPEAVVPPAFAELLLRLSRARMAPRPSPTLPQEERLLFDHGVKQRRQVLEHTLCVVFAQWAIYRRFVSHVQLRPLRWGYSVAAAFASVAFVRHRAARVSRDLFEHAVTAHPSSALANEARIILAELEGPDGPYLRDVRRRRVTSDHHPDLHDSNADADADATLRSSLTDSYMHAEGDGAEGDVHPQLRLEPRLLTAEVAAATPVSPMQARARLRDMATRPPAASPPVARDLDVDRSPPPLQHIRMRSRGLADLDAEDRAAVPDGPEFEPWGKPFDFAANAAQPAFDDGPASLYDAVSEDDGPAPITPAQRRAAERRKRRQQAQRKEPSY